VRSSGDHTVIAVINRSNQRGGRMLSVLDLIDAGTLSVIRTAGILDHILSGSSWLVGARPGGAGKTTIMAALLAMLPPQTRIHVADRGGEWKRARRGDCVVAYEISPGSYDAYVWGEELRVLVDLGLRGCRIVSNLHADTIEQAHGQIVGDNEVAEDAFATFDLFLPVSFPRRARIPAVQTIHVVSDGVWREASGADETSRSKKIATWLHTCISDSDRGIEDVRGRWMAWLAEQEDRP